MQNGAPAAVTSLALDSGLGWKTVAKVEGKDAIPPIKCTVERAVEGAR